MRIRDLMTKSLETIGPDEPLRQAAERMRIHSIGALPVMEGGQLVGMLTDRDITVRSTAMGKDPNVTRVRDAMTSAVITCGPDDPLSEAERLMEDWMVRRLIVVDSERHPLGLISLDDLATVPGERMVEAREEAQRSPL
ncbi:CBS domain-containing protein [Corallococcus sp. H22C18031201]|uniref:CBS domain-containing protein n=1 Tax=Citreicoccus inhibens TaxID=2849499 RepID=UPI000E74ACD2|nr:CBS domain-containing protein [Citreicoccus inhibens]MBU8895080.1 CBS domain-containing protein [Citreicoccus inhibens]RJS27227.1 CBS domain-containing protein [Corallococcus sp. H22C18031201]